MEALETTMKNCDINIDFSSSNSSSHGHELFYYSFSSNAISMSSSDEWLIDSRESYHMAKVKTIFLLLMNVTPKNIFW
jgi:hypothetical protein